MTNNEIYLAILGSLAMFSAGVVLFSIDRTNKHRVRYNSRRRKDSNEP